MRHRHQGTGRRPWVGLALGVLLACGGGGSTPPPPPPPSYPTALSRAQGVAQGLLASATRDGQGLRWRVVGSDFGAEPLDLYDGSPGTLVFLARLHHADPTPDLQAALAAGGQWLRAKEGAWSYGKGLFEGRAGFLWAYLGLYEALGDAGWLDSARATAAALEADDGSLRGDLISGVPGQGMAFLKLYALTGETRWRDAARTKGDLILASAVPVGAGLKVPSFQLPDGRTVFYPGLSHGTAGAAFFLARLSRALGTPDGDAYRSGALQMARWLQDRALPNGSEGLTWYRREPDQLDQLQATWCHGAPGICIAFAELYDLTGDAVLLAVATKAAWTVEQTAGEGGFACRCHGLSGNAEAFLKLYRVTGDPAWKAKAEAFGEQVWGMRLPGGTTPRWTSGDGSGQSQSGLMTGQAGMGDFYLELHSGGQLGMPVTD
ncbi:MAG TPA: lanthionine synthetase LanC family protein [Holophagaceae bacterium]|nr:lanthionine synthetase LanC family protein [Holophagaceae bacterium]